MLKDVSEGYGMQKLGGLTAGSMQEVRLTPGDRKNLRADGDDQEDDDDKDEEGEEEEEEEDEEGEDKEEADGQKDVSDSGGEGKGDHDSQDDSDGDSEQVTTFKRPSYNKSSAKPTKSSTQSQLGNSNADPGRLSTEKLDPHHPGQFFELQDRLKIMGMDVCETFKVNGIAADQFFLSLVKDIGEDKRVQNMDITGLVSTAVNARDALRNMAESVEDWKPDQFPDRKKAFDEAIVEFKAALGKLVAYKSSLVLAAQRKKNNVQDDKRKERVRQNALAEKLIKCDCPDAFAKNIASHLEPRRGKDWGSSCAVLSAAESSDPRMVLDDTHDYALPGALLGERSDMVLDGILHAAWQELEVACTQRTTSAIDFMVSTRDKAGLKEKTHLATNFGQFNIDLKDIIKPKCEKRLGVDPILVVQKAWHYADKVSDNPFVGVPSLIHCTSGLLHITLIEISYVIDCSQHLVSMRDHFNTMGAEEYKKLKSFIIKEGDSVWCPCGYAASVVAIGAESEKDTKLKYSAFIQYAVLADEFAENLNPIVAAEIKSWITAGIAKGLKVYNSSKSAMTAWTDKFKVAVAVPEDET